MHGRGQLPSMFSSAEELVAHQPLLPRHQSAVSYLVLLCDDQEFQHQSQATSYSHTYGRGTSAKQAPKTRPTGSSQPSRLPKAGHQARVPAGITCGKGMTEGALRPFSQNSGSRPCAFFSLLADGCRFRALSPPPPPPRTGGPRASPGSCASARHGGAARRRDVARGHRALLAAF